MSNDETSNIPSITFNEEDSKLLELFKLAKSNPHLKSALVKSLLGDDLAERKHTIKALGGYNSNQMGYYNEESALKVKEIVDEMIKEKDCEFELRYSDYPGYKANTLRKKLHEGLRYLVEKLDPTQEYAKWRANIEVQAIKIKGQDIGIKFAYINEAKVRKLKFSLRKVPKEVEPGMVIISDAEWKQTILDFMDSEHQSIALTDLNLNKDDKNWINNLFTNPGDFVVKVTTVGIKINRAANWPENEPRVLIE